MDDIITGFQNQQYQRDDLHKDWNKTLNLGTAKKGKIFEVDALLGGTNNRGDWDSVDRLKFNVNSNLHLELNTDPNVITELVKFENGVASVVGSVEYGSHLSLDLSPGKYGLSFFVEGDLVGYQVSGEFS